MFEIYLFYAFIAFLLTYFATPIVIRASYAIGALDHPGVRRIHKKATPNIGGLAIFFGFIMVTIFSLELSREVLGLILGSTLMLIMGFVDDIVGLKAIPKLISQITGALILIYFGISIEFLTNPTGATSVFALGWLSYPLTVIWIVGITNAINIIDGIDGQAAGVVTISAAVIAAVAVLTGRPQILPLALYLGASSLAFLRYNFFPAKIFMGDTGSQFLGFTLAGIAIIGTLKSAALISLLIPALAVGVPLFDTAAAIIRRTKNKKPIAVADKEHLHHFFLNMGYNQRQAVLIMYGLNTILGLLAIISTQVSSWQSVVLFLMAIIFMIFIKTGKFKTKKSTKTTVKKSSEKKNTKKPVKKEKKK